MRKICLQLIILGCFINSQPLAAQNCLDFIKSNPLYSNSNEIINGRKWINESRYYIGSPMLKEDYWPKADILYNGSIFKGIHLNYDVYKNDLIVYHPERGHEKYLIVNKDHLSGFSFTDSLLQRHRQFEFTELAGIGGKALYEKIPVDKVSLYIRPMVKLDKTPSERTMGKYTALYKYYLDTGQGFSSFSSKSQLIKLLANNRAEMTRFIRKQKLKINKKHPEDIVTAIKYFDGLN